MTTKNNKPGDAADLRKRAEKIAGKTAQSPEAREALSPEETRRTLHELRVHQIELEMQNEELRRAQAELETSRARYYDLYDLAPVGYCTISEQGLILEANLTAATMLGLGRRALAKQRLTRFILREDQSIFYLHRKQLVETGERQAFELRMARTDGTVFSALLEATAARDLEGAPTFRIVLSDITERKETEQRLRYLSMHDVLTGLYNRAYFDESMERLERGRQFPISVLMADVDNLKTVNDRRGHAAGDSLLKNASHLLVVSFRAEDVIARIGGDEFAILMPGTTAEAAQGALLRFRHLLQERNAASPEPPVQLCCGIGTAERGVPLIEALRVADTNLYLEKQGRSVTPKPEQPAEAASPSAAAGQALRHRATETSRKQGAPSPEEIEALSPEQVKHTLHELRVHQIELEMQNEELRRAQAELETARTRYYDLYDVSPVGYCTISGPGLILEANLAAAALLGVARGALVQQPISRFILPEDQDIYYLHRKHLLETGTPQTCEPRMVKQDGAIFWAHLEAATAQDEGGAPVLHLVLSDITEYKRAEEALVRERNLLRTLMDNLPDKVYIKDAETRYVVNNPAHLRSLGVTQQEDVLGKTSFDFFPQPLAAQYHADDQEVIRSGQPLVEREEIVVDLATGQPAWHLTTKVPLRDSQGKVVGLVGVSRDITERKRAEEALRVKDWAIESAINAVAISDLAGNLTYVNPAFLKLWGYSSPAEVLEKSATTFWQMGEKAAEVIEALRTKGGWIGELVAHQGKDGALFDVQVSASLVVDAAGQPICMQASFADITERKRAEEALHASEAKYRLLVESLNEGIWMIDEQAVTTFVNPRMGEMLGYTVEEMLGRPLFSFMDEQGVQIATLNLARRRQGVKEQHDFQFLRKDGTRIHVRLETAPVTDLDGAYRGAIAGVMDITERKLAEEALRESEAKYRSLFEKMVAGFALHEIICDDSGRAVDYRTLEVNPEFERLLGMPRDLVVGKLFTEAGPTDERFWIDLFGKVALTGEPDSYELFSPHNRKWFSGLAYRTEPGKFAVSFTDITERKQAEQTIRASLLEKEILLREIHHRVKNNLQIIASLLTLQAETVRDPAALAVFKDSQNRIRAMSLIHAKLYQSTDLAKVDFGAFVRDLGIILLRAYAVNPSAIHLQVSAGQADLAIDDLVPCSLIVNELLTNAVKYAFPSGAGGTITVEFSRQDGGYILRVADNGVGFPGAVDFRDTESLGLRLVILLVEQLEGAIELRNEGGTEFTIRFPGGPSV